MIKLSDIKKTLPFSVKTGGTSYSVREYISPDYDINIDYDVFLPTKNKNLQRPLCWTLNQKRELIMSIFKGMEIPSVSFIVYAEKNLGDSQIHKVIDGKQRISTVLAFAKGEFGIVWEGFEYLFKDLPEDMQDLFLRFTFTKNVAYEYADRLISDDDKIAWFEMINWGGTPQDVEHMKSLKV